MGPVDALELALSKEIQAINLYKRLSLEYSETKETFYFLVNEEEKHKRLLENKIQELTQ